MIRDQLISSSFEMDSLLLRSTVYSNPNGTPFVIKVPRESIAQYPNSLLFSALHLDPTAEQIDIPNPDVTINALTALKYILTYEILPIVEPDAEYDRAGKYLGIEPLSLLGDPAFAKFRREHHIGWLHFDPEYYGEVLTFAINESPVLFRYLLGLVPPEQTRTEDAKGIIQASEMGNLVAVEYLLRRGADPSADDNAAIIGAAENGHSTMVDRLLKDKRVDPSARDNHAIIWASYGGYLDIVNRLLAWNTPESAPMGADSPHLWERGRKPEVGPYPRVDPSADNNAAMTFAQENGHDDVVDRLLQDPRVASTYQSP